MSVQSSSASTPFETAARLADGSFRVAKMLRAWMESATPERWGELESVASTGVDAVVGLTRQPHEGLAVLAVARAPLPSGFPFEWDELSWLVEELPDDEGVRAADDTIGPAILSAFGAEFASVGHRVLVDAHVRRIEAAEVSPRLHEYWLRHGPEHWIGAGDPAVASGFLLHAKTFTERLDRLGVDAVWPEGIEDERIERLLSRHRDLLRSRPEAWPSVLFDGCVEDGVGVDEIEKVYGLSARDLPMRLVTKHPPPSPERHDAAPPGPILALSVEADGAHAITVDGAVARRWELGSGSETRIEIREVTDLAVAARREVDVAAHSNGSITLWSRSSSEPVRLDGHRGGVSCVAVSPNEALVASGGHDHSVAVWDLEKGALVRRFAGHFGAVVDVTWASDGKEVVSASDDGTVRVWSLEHDEPRLVIEGDGTPATACHVHTDWVVVGYEDGALRAYQLDDGAEQMNERKHAGAIRAIVTHEDGRMFTASDDRTIHAWPIDASAPKVLYAHAEAVTCLALAGDRLLSGSRDHTMIEWDLESLEPKRRYGDYGWPGGLERPVLTLKGGGTVEGSADGSVRLVRSGERRTLDRARAGVSALAEWNRRLVVGGDDGSIELLDLPEFESLRLLRGHRRRVNGLVVLPDDRLLSWSLDATIRLWDLESGKLLATTYGTAPFVGLDVVAFDPFRFTAEDADGGRWEMALDGVPAVEPSP